MFMKQCVLDTLAHQNKIGEISLALIDKATMQALNWQHRQKDYATNVLSFPADIPIALKQTIPFLGDIIICPEVAQDEALKHNKPFQNHMAHLLIHGTLHVLGHDHEKDEDATVMENIEIQLLQNLNIPNPYTLRASRDEGVTPRLQEGEMF